ncbi:hypothetical protein CHLRE_06g305550v5 [Chlamydomonas reinhardtii]|uniref:RING-type domain-containing protein n=1 Tax=Chlamydomonas reinhardtii TaxID=3055 RepID=A0A2K3DRB1_CHLRE|nr:uncharacterized protein CHLRE_06g305550v5 [Chlamydomonas reinhardtii]PNW83070.1 hypothetical protein CHLRE_06g305550v5 [Chlamydomonas reinhardtii]
MHAGASWLAVTLPDGRIGWCKQYDEAHMVQHHNTKTGFGWYRVLYCSLTDQNTYGMGLETLTPELLSDLAAAPPGPPPSLGVPRSEGATPACTHTHPHPHSHAHASSTSTAAAAAVAAAGGGGGSGHTAAGVGTAGGVGAGGCQQQLACGRDRCSSCWLPLRLGCMAYVGSCGHSFHFECLKGLGDANICTTCGVWYAVGQSPPDSCPAPSPTSIFQHVHQTLWFVPPFYRYILIYAVMLLASPFIILASWMGLLQ